MNHLNHVADGLHEAGNLAVLGGQLRRERGNDAAAADAGVGIANDVVATDDTDSSSSAHAHNSLVVRLAITSPESMAMRERFSTTATGLDVSIGTDFTPFKV